MRALTGFREIADAYDGFIIDLWGVIHDGVTPYAGAVDCLLALRDAGRPTVLLSNAPRRVHVAQHAMRGMGIADALYTDLLTSGEQTWRMLRDRDDPFFAGLGDRVFHLGPDRDRNVIEGLKLQRVAQPADADFVLNTGPDETSSVEVLEPHLPVLHDCHAAGLPMICANPDLEVIRGGRRVICAGLLTQYYERLGGRTRWIGKPDPAIYTPVLARLGLPASRVLAVGDALRTDIAGAASAGVDACWVLGGIHGDELAGDPARAQAAAAAAGLAPVASLAAFVW
ncbi:MAG: TIGR01459 family HAD-type hydrolase [Acetobacteraceae bacterium]|nr:TIGR01459 family HAD-type hydrolase [Acetobacteraceae bacterium]